MTGVEVTRFIMGLKTPEACRRLIEHEGEIHARIGFEYGVGRIVVERNVSGDVVFLMTVGSQLQIVASLNESTFITSETNPLAGLTIYPPQLGNTK